MRIGRQMSEGISMTHGRPSLAGWHHPDKQSLTADQIAATKRGLRQLGIPALASDSCLAEVIGAGERYLTYTPVFMADRRGSEYKGILKQLEERIIATFTEVAGLDDATYRIIRRAVWYPEEQACRDHDKINVPRAIALGKEVDALIARLTDDLARFAALLGTAHRMIKDGGGKRERKGAARAFRSYIRNLAQIYHFATGKTAPPHGGSNGPFAKFVQECVSPIAPERCTTSLGLGKAIKKALAPKSKTKSVSVKRNNPQPPSEKS
ncbi:MAG TPA: hypothetical protein VLQ80_29260 [Candidatus Saccharimonadia bacterium]|nr:hypothetical protein [Candidatus Saccharimonadia bacterium]